MKNLLKIFILVLFLNVTAKAMAGNKNGNNPLPSNENGGNSDSTIGIKSNIVIFKIISTPPTPINNSNGSLRKAGKAARTSYSHTSIDTILNQNKGI